MVHVFTDMLVYATTDIEVGVLARVNTGVTVKPGEVPRMEKHDSGDVITENPVTIAGAAAVPPDSLSYEYD